MNKVAVVTVATKEYLSGAETLFYSITKHSKNLDDVDFICVTGAAVESKIFDILGVKQVIGSTHEDVRMKYDYRDRWKNVFLKLNIYKIFGYEQLIYIDADCVVLDDISKFYEHNKFPLYFLQDVAAKSYYSGTFAVDRYSTVVNAGVIIINSGAEEMCQLFFDDAIGEKLSSYDGSDQGLINEFIKKFNISVGELPINFNCIYKDAFYEQQDDFVVHFTGAKPWASDLQLEMYVKWRTYYVEATEFANKQFFVREPGACISGLTCLINDLPSNAMIVEIGSYAGESTNLFANYFKSVVAIDPWVNGYDDADSSSYKYGMSLIKKAFDYSMSRYNNVKAIRSESAEASKMFQDKSIDIVYVDGDHKYAGVVQDLKTWTPKIKSGGFLCGHDYTVASPGVMKAVDEVVGTPGSIYQDSSWKVVIK